MDKNKFVSRGGTKLEHALNTFGVDIKDKIVLDVGSSTGGFVDCLLQHGATKVYSVDTAYGELAWTLRKDPRVVVMERKNVLDMTDPSDLPGLTDLVTIDVTFTSLEKILPIIKKFLKPGGKVIALLKPQYEESELALRNKGVIPINNLPEIVKEIRFKIQDLGFNIISETDSPILGGGGNKEFLFSLEILDPLRETSKPE